MDYYKCRLCLEDTSRCVEIFQDTFPEMLEILSGIKVDPKDGLPTTSCIQCHQEVKSAMLTRYQIINSHKILLDELNIKNSVEKVFSEFSNIIDELKPDSELLDSDNKDVGENQQANFNETVADDCYDNLNSFSCDENDRSDSSDAEKDCNKDDIKIPKEVEIESDKVTKKKIKTEIKFKKKKTQKQKVPEDRIDFKKKKSKENGFSVKVEYVIKPEHQELLKTVGRKDRVNCPDCGKEMFGMNLKNHLITHNHDPVICDICGKTSKNAQALQDHINYYHKTTPDRFMCDKCGKGYRVRFMLERHEKKEHGTGEKDYECSICGKKFYEKLHLKNHINITHNKIKAYKCVHCGKDFGRRTQFVTHQLVHTKENRYHCQVCGKGFKIKQTMQTHLKGVHGIEEEKTIFCKICQKGFSTPQGLRAHVNSRVHGLQRCEHCSEFITVEYKSAHLKQIHGIDADTEAYS